MKKVLLGILVGLVGGAAVTAWLVRRPASPAAAAPEAPAAGAVEASGRAGVRMTPEQQTRAGVVLAAPQLIALQTERKAYGRVLDPAPLVTALAEVETAQAALSASQKEFARVEKLHAENENASAQALETAEAAVKRDRTQVNAARGRLLAGWGAALAGRADLAALVRRLVTQKAALVRIDLPPEEGAPVSSPATARLSAATGGADLPPAEVIGSAPDVDPQVQGWSYLALLSDCALPAGTEILAFLPIGETAASALAVPRSAVVFHQGGSYVFVPTAPDRFERRPVEIGRSVPAGLVITHGLTAQDRVVTTGAQQLLSAELLPAGGGGD
jgi:hypothetical protein